MTPGKKKIEASKPPVLLTTIEEPINFLEAGGHTLYGIGRYTMVGDGPINTIIRHFLVQRNHRQELLQLNTSATVFSDLSVARMIDLYSAVLVFGGSVVCSAGELELSSRSANLQRMKNELAQVVQLFTDRGVKKMAMLLPLEYPKDDATIRENKNATAGFIKNNLQPLSRSIKIYNIDTYALFGSHGPKFHLDKNTGRYYLARAFHSSRATSSK